jgi:hypothetical protein
MGWARSIASTPTWTILGIWHGVCKPGFIWALAPGMIVLPLHVLTLVLSFFYPYSSVLQMASNEHSTGFSLEPTNKCGFTGTSPRIPSSNSAFALVIPDLDDATTLTMPPELSLRSDRLHTTTLWLPEKLQSLLLSAAQFHVVFVQLAHVSRWLPVALCASAIEADQVAQVARQVWPVNTAEIMRQEMVLTSVEFTHVIKIDDLWSQHRDKPDSSLLGFLRKQRETYLTLKLDNCSPGVFCCHTFYKFTPFWYFKNW